MNGLVKILVVAALAASVAWNALLARALVTDLRMNDFGRFHFAAESFLRGGGLYDPRPAHLRQGREVEGSQLGNLNPPHFHILLLPLGLLPRSQALLVWGLGSLAAVFLSFLMVLRELGLRLTFVSATLTAVLLLNFVGTTMVMVTGQLSFLLLWPITASWVAARRGAWVRAACLCGIAASVKPFLVLLLPLFALRGGFRSASAGLLAAGAAFVVGVIVFGVEAHADWIGELSSVRWTWANTNASIYGLLARSLSDSGSVAPVALAPHLVRPLWLVGSLLIGSAALVVAGRGQGPRAVDRGFALLLLASLLVSPLGWAYYLSWPLGPLIALARDSRATLAGGARERTCVLLGGIALVALLWPFPATDLCQPAPLATITVGSIYFWGTFALVACLIIDAGPSR
jgi:hypothetical protein